MKVFFQFLMAAVMVPAHSRFLDGPVHSFHLTVGPGMFDLGQSMFDSVTVADAIERCHEGHGIAFSVDKLDSIVC